MVDVDMIKMGNIHELTLVAVLLWIGYNSGSVCMNRYYI